MGEPIERRLTIGITGAQGVGKSTFCEKLATALRQHMAAPISILPSIGEGLRRQGISYGSAATAESVLAIYAAHLERGREAPAGGIQLLDRCAVDALCYTRALGLNSAAEVRLLTEVSHAMAAELDFVVHLTMDGIFADSTASHETPELRRSVALEFEKALADLSRPHCSLYAAAPDAVAQAVSEIRMAQSTCRSTR